MDHPVLDDDKEPPLDPAAERLQAKLKRLLVVSSLIMVLGFVAIFAAILYKLTAGSGKGPDEEPAATIALPADAEVLSMTISEGRLILLVRQETRQSLFYFDPMTGRQLGRSDFVFR